MTYEEKDKLEEQDIIEEMEEEIEEIENEDGEIDEEKLEEALSGEESESTRLKELVSKLQADYDNFKKRTERDKQDMVFFLKSDIFKKILPRVDDLERIVKNTPKDMQNGAVFEGVVTLEKTLKKDLESLSVKPFESLGEEVDADKHDVMTTVPGKQKDIVVDEFEKGYMLGDRVLRHAKVVVGAGE